MGEESAVRASIEALATGHLMQQEWRRRATLVLGLIAGGAAVATISYQVSPWIALAAPIALGYLVLSALRPVQALMIACVLVVFEDHQLPLGVIGSLSPSEFAFLLVGAGWVWRALEGRSDVRYVQIADYPIAALVLSVSVGLAVGVPVTTVVRFLVVWTAFFFVFLTVKGFAPQDVRRVLLALAVGGGALAALGARAYLRGGGATLTQSGAGVTGRAAAAIADPNYYGAYLQLAAVPLLALLVLGRLRPRLPWIGVLSLMMAGIALSLSRGAVLGVVLGVGVVVLASARTRAVSLFVVTVMVATAAINVNPLLSSGTSEVIAERLSSVGVQSENNKRTLLWSRAIELTISHPEGIGALQFQVASERFGLTQLGSPLENVHNTYLNIAVELGLLGLLGYLAWLVRVGWDIAVEWRRRRRATFALAVGIGASLCGYSLQALTVSQYRVETIFATFFVLAGAAAALRAWPDDAISYDFTARENQVPTAATAASGGSGVSDVPIPWAPAF